MLVGVGTNATYGVLTFTPAAASSGSETVILNSSSASGLSILVSGSFKLFAGVPSTVPFKVDASAAVVPGNYTLEIGASSNGVVQSVTLKVMVVQNIVYLQGFSFLPTNLTVSQGSTVYFYNADAPHNWCGAFDSGDKVISFTSGTSTTSPTVSSFTSWSFTFSAPGTYTYIDTDHVDSGTASVVVTA